MHEVARYLLRTEVPVVLTRLHWASLCGRVLRPLAVSAFALFVVVYLGDAQFFAEFGVILMLGGLGWLGWMVADWYTERFVITDKRVLLVTGLISRRVAIMPLNRVTDLTYERTIAGRLFGYGVFVMESAGQNQALSRIGYLPKPDKLYRDVSMLLFGSPPNAATGGRPSLADLSATAEDLRAAPTGRPARATDAESNPTDPATGATDGLPPAEGSGTSPLPRLY